MRRTTRNSSQDRNLNRGHNKPPSERRGKSMEDYLEDLFLKKASTRENALSLLVDGFRNELQHKFSQDKCITLLYRALNSIKIGSTKEIQLASKIIGYLSLTIGSEDNLAHEILEDSISPLSRALKSRSETLKISSLLECLAIITFVGGTNAVETERSMQVMWELMHSESSSNVITNKSKPEILTAAISAWTFLLATMYGWNINAKIWKESLSLFSNLLNHTERSVRIVAGEALIIIYEIGTLEKFSNEGNGSHDCLVQEGDNTHIQCSRRKFVTQLKQLTQVFQKDDYPLKNSIEIGEDVLNIPTWSQLIQVNFLKHFLEGGFVMHMQENELLHDFFEFTPKRKLQLPDYEEDLFDVEEVATHYVYQPEHIVSRAVFQRMYKSPNSLLNKAKSKMLKKERLQSRARKVGDFSVRLGENDVVLS